jgi:hypothetical protein
MSLAQRLAWTDGASTLAVLSAASAVWLSETPHDARRALVLAGTSLLVADAIIDGSLAAYALLVGLSAMLVLRLAVYTPDERAFSKRSGAWPPRGPSSRSRAANVLASKGNTLARVPQP